MIRLPPKRPKVRSGIMREPRRDWPRHRAFLRTFGCVVEGCANTPIEVSHLRTAANSGTGLKPSDNFAVPKCSIHHHHYHEIGHAAFERLYKIDLFALAAEFTARSPDKAMREALAEMDTLGHV